MLGRSLASLLLTNDFATCLCFSTRDVINTAPNTRLLNFLPNRNRGACSSGLSTKKWVLHSTAETEISTLKDEERKAWETCREAPSAFGISIEGGEKTLGKAFGLVHSPYWGEKRKTEVPKFEILKKFREVLGCELERELKTNVQILEKEWGIKGKSLRNLLLRNPRVLGFNVDCKGDCMA
ncbi:hypothetical protein D8674_004397 [Pyrus ussuriensis x Pyrus communis]|uniref:Uncharacterized protein n=1 Tax=Pyrus ussuriensis x Pyrus communis TaxID=2448454 RepID=A0A5N5FQ67_9ROSA|nr:hypothetical protein D8674_004397 [Pyrus ussuriensis x Pyrus communis]